MRIRKNKKGYSPGFGWIFGLVSLFGLGLLYIIFSQVFYAHLIPIIKNQVNNSAIPIDIASVNEINQNIDRYMVYFNIVPFILFFVVIIFMIVTGIRREGESNFGG